ncbi:hypothetical protein Tco_0690540 [Tanacetum coccineum]
MGDLTTRVSLFNFCRKNLAKLRNDILMFHNIKENIFLKHGLVSKTLTLKIPSIMKHRSLAPSPNLDLTLYDNESWNDARDFAKPVKAISLPQDVSSTSDRHLAELENQVQRLMEAHFAPKKAVQVNKITSSCEICSGPHDIYYQAKLERTLSEFDSHQERRLSSLGAQLRRQQDDMINKINILWKVFSEKLDDTSTHDTAGDSPKYLSQVSLEEQNRNLSSPKRVHFINFVVILRKGDEVREKENVKPNATEYSDHEMTAKAEEKVEDES